MTAASPRPLPAYEAAQVEVVELLLRAGRAPEEAAGIVRLLANPPRPRGRKAAEWRIGRNHDTPSERTSLRRFGSIPPGGGIRRAPADAIREARTVYQKTVVDPEDSPRLLVSGQNNRKLGGKVQKGPWRGMPVFQLTLEERATCPRSCAQWSKCYGNNMHLARRHRHGPALEARLRTEVATLAAAHPRGFVIRLHLLGDFYSAAYVRLWAELLDAHRALRIFGFTAWGPETPIGTLIQRLRRAAWHRFAVRFSNRPGPGGAEVVKRIEDASGIVCPAQTGRTACCSTCGLCWHPSFAAGTISFLDHGGGE